MEDGIAGETEFAEDFADGAHDFGQAFGAEDNQRDRKNDSYFEKVQTSMMVRRDCRCNSMTLLGAEKFRAVPSASCQLITIPDRGVNDA